MTTKVVKGSLWTLAGQIAPLAVSLITTPFVIRMLGAESYGVLILVGLIPNYVGFLDFGMSIASTRFGSEAYGRGDLIGEAKIVRTAAVLALLFSLPVAIGIFSFSPWLLTFFNVPDGHHAEAVLALKFAAVTYILTILNSIFNTLQLTRLRMDLNTFIGAGFRIVGLIATPFAVYYEGVAGAVFVLMAAAFLTAVSNIAVSGRLNRHLFDLSIDRAAVRPMVRFGGALVISGIATMLLSNGEKAILSVKADVVSLAYYSVAFSLAAMMTMFTNSMVQSLLPAFSQLQEESERNRLERLYSFGLRLNLIWMIPALSLLAVGAKSFFSIWAGDDFGRESTLPFYILLIGLAMNIIAYVPSVTLLAAGRTEVLAKLYWIELIPYLALVWFLTGHFGIVGTAMAWSIRVIGDLAAMFVLVRRYVGVSHSIRGPGSLIFAGAIMISPFALMLYEGDVNLSVAAAAALALVLYVLMVWKFVLTDEESVWILDRVQGRLSLSFLK